MPCSYCHSIQHNITYCDKALVDRAIEIYNYNKDSCYKSRKINAHWFKDTNGRMPNEDQWISMNSGYYKYPENNVFSLLQVVRTTSPNYPILNGHRFLSYIMREYSDKNNREFVRLEVNNDNKIKMEYFNGQVGEDAYQQYVRELRELREKRGIYQHQQIQNERFKGLVLKEKVIETDECPICMLTLEKTNRVVLRCGHQFCGDCIFHHIQTANGTRCPCCRQQYTLQLNRR